MSKGPTKHGGLERAYTPDDFEQDETDPEQEMMQALADAGNHELGEQQ